MSASTFTPKLVCLNATRASYIRRPSTSVRGFQLKLKDRSHAPIRFVSFKTYAALADPFVLEIAETLEDSVSSLSPSHIPPPLQKLRDVSSESLLSLAWPSRKDEAFRFTDVSSLRSSHIHPVASPPLDTGISRISEDDDQVPNLVIVDGYVVTSLSNLPTLPDGVFVGSLSNLSSETVLQKVHEFVSNFEGDLFWSLNGVGAPDLTIIYIPEGCRVETPLHLRYYSAEGSDAGSNHLPISNPRVLVLVEKGGGVDIIEEYLGADGKCYWTNSVLEVVIGQGATVNHSYIQSQSLGAAHIKWTSVRQEAASTYKLVEVSSGGKLSRHNFHVQQVGPDTVTELSTLHLSVGDQTQDLHSRLVLDHPRGYSRQLHKCIVGHPQGQAIFDGNVRVNRYAQQTDAGQLTRSLLLVPRATVNVKPNLQIIADDVKCSHGAAISDLEEDQLFYFQARGIDAATARQALVYSFGAEVIEKIPNSSMRDKVKNLIANVLGPTLATS